MHIRNSHQHENWPFGFHKHHKCDLGSFSETALRWNGDKIETLSYSSKAVMSKNLHFMSSAFKICLHLSWYQSLQSNIVDLIKNWNISHNFLPFLHIIWATYCNFACLFLLLLKTYRRNILRWCWYIITYIRPLVSLLRYERATSDQQNVPLGVNVVMVCCFSR